jgi:hypothetical protein
VFNGRKKLSQALIGMNTSGTTVRPELVSITGGGVLVAGWLAEPWQACRIPARKMIIIKILERFIK